MVSAPLDLTSMRVADYYSATRNALAVSLQRIASGKKLQDPSDGVPEFMRAQRLRSDNRGYGIVQTDLKRGLATVNVGEKVGDNIVQNFQRMRQLVTMYWKEEDPLVKDAMQAEFDELAADIDRQIANGYYDDNQLIQNTSTVTEVMLDPNDVDNKLAISFTDLDAIDTSGLDIRGEAGVDESEARAKELLEEQYGNALGYVARLSGYRRSLEAHLSMTDAVVQNNRAYESTLSDVDDAEELNRMVAHEVRQSASLSMLSQANMLRSGVLRLLE